MTITKSYRNPKRQYSGLNAWFWIGSIVAFCLLAIFFPLPFFDGKLVLRTRLWQFYLLTIRSIFSSSGTLGPTTGRETTLLIVIASHIGISLAVGFLLMGLSWFVNRPAAKLPPAIESLNDEATLEKDGKDQ